MGIGFLLLRGRGSSNSSSSSKRVAGEERLAVEDEPAFTPALGAFFVGGFLSAFFAGGLLSAFLALGMAAGAGLGSVARDLPLALAGFAILGPLDLVGAMMK